MESRRRLRGISCSVIVSCATSDEGRLAADEADERRSTASRTGAGQEENGQQRLCVRQRDRLCRFAEPVSPLLHSCARLAFTTQHGLGRRANAQKKSFTYIHIVLIRGIETRGLPRRGSVRRARRVTGRHKGAGQRGAGALLQVEQRGDLQATKEGRSACDTQRSAGSRESGGPCYLLSQCLTTCKQFLGS